MEPPGLPSVAMPARSLQALTKQYLELSATREQFDQGFELPAPLSYWDANRPPSHSSVPSYRDRPAPRVAQAEQSHRPARERQLIHLPFQVRRVRKAPELRDVANKGKAVGKGHRRGRKWVLLRIFEKRRPKPFLAERLGQFWPRPGHGSQALMAQGASRELHALRIEVRRRRCPH